MNSYKTILTTTAVTKEPQYEFVVTSSYFAKLFLLLLNFFPETYLYSLVKIGSAKDEVLFVVVIVVVGIVVVIPENYLSVVVGIAFVIPENYLSGQNLINNS